MNIDFAFVCDYADPMGKLGALGIGFDTIYASEVPCVHPSFHFVMQIRGSTAEAGSKAVTISLIDADGKEIVAPVSPTVELPEPLPGAVDSYARLVVAFNGIPFCAHGQYALHVVVQGHEMVRIPIRVAQPPSTR